MQSIIKISLFAFIISSHVNAKCKIDNDCQPGYSCENKYTKIHHKHKLSKRNNSTLAGYREIQPDLAPMPLSKKPGQYSNPNTKQSGLTPRSVGSKPVILLLEPK